MRNINILSDIFAYNHMVHIREKYFKRCFAPRLHFLIINYKYCLEIKGKLILYDMEKGHLGKTIVLLRSEFLFAENQSFLFSRSYIS